MDTPNTTPVPDPEKSNKMLFGILSYLGPFVIVSYLVKENDPFVRFHIKQGLVLLSIEIISWLLSTMVAMWSLWQFIRIVNLAVLVLAVIGIINVVKWKEKELPLVGGLARYVPI